jgi:hypothetical protein
MSSRFRTAGEIKPDDEAWESLAWVSHPQSTGAKLLTIVEAIFACVGAEGLDTIEVCR